MPWFKCYSRKNFKHLFAVYCLYHYHDTSALNLLLIIFLDVLKHQMLFVYYLHKLQNVRIVFPFSPLNLIYIFYMILVNLVNIQNYYSRDCLTCRTCATTFFFKLPSYYIFVVNINQLISLISKSQLFECSHSQRPK